MAGDMKPCVVAVMTLLKNEEECAHTDGIVSLQAHRYSPATAFYSWQRLWGIGGRPGRSREGVRMRRWCKFSVDFNWIYLILCPVGLWSVLLCVLWMFLRNVSWGCGELTLYKLSPEVPPRGWQMGFL